MLDLIHYGILLIIMEVKQNFDRLADDVQEYIDLRIDSIKLYVVQVLASFISDMLSRVVLFVFLFLSLVFMLIALMFLLAPLIGRVWSACVIVILLLLMAFFVYLGRKSLFANMMIGRLCKMFFPVDDEKE